MKRKIISIITLLMLIAQMILPGIVNATSKNEDKTGTDKNSAQNTVRANSSDLEVEGNGTIGKLLAQELSQEADNTDSSIYGIIDVEMNNNTALIDYYTKVDATIIVGIYDEEKTRIITLGSVEVKPEEEETYIELPSEKMPEYYYLKAFMVDKDNNPLCKPYSTTLYTQGIQKVTQMTTDEFESERILNFDEDENTNFAVYKENTIVIKEDESEIKLISADEQNKIYVFENIDDTIKNLKKGDTLVYETINSQEIVVKISNISIDESKATITGEKIELEDIFEYIKIETISSDMEVDVEEEDDESIIFKGIENKSSEPNNLFKTSLIGDNTETLGTKASFEFMEKKFGGDNANVTLTGNIDFGFSITTNYYFNLNEVDNTFFSIKESVNLSGNISISGKIVIPALTLAKMNLKFPKNDENPLIEIKFNPGLIIEVSAGISCSFSLESFSSQMVTTDGITYTSTPIKIKTEDLLNNELKIFIGLDISPKLEVNMLKKKKDENNSSISISFSIRLRC